MTSGVDVELRRVYCRHVANAACLEGLKERSGAVQINIRACIYSWIAQVWFLWVRSNKGGGGITSTVGEGGLSALSGSKLG